eukprot:2287370-Prymnesium_polylepis.1
MPARTLPTRAPCCTPGYRGEGGQGGGKGDGQGRGQGDGQRRRPQVPHARGGAWLRSAPLPRADGGGGAADFYAVPLATQHGEHWGGGGAAGEA